MRLEYCKVVAEFLCPIDSSYFTKDEPDTEFDKMLRDKVVSNCKLNSMQPSMTIRK